MAWMIVSDDSPGGAAIRANRAVMDAHWAYELSIKDKILCAGSLRRIPRAIRFSLRFGNSSALALPVLNGTNAGSPADRIISSSAALGPMAVGWPWSISACGSGISFA